MDSIKAKIVELVPEIMELKHGNRFRWNGDVWFINCVRCSDERVFAYSCTGDMHDFSNASLGEKDKWEYKYKHFLKSDFNGEDAEYFEILGRPITLADVLMVLGKQDYGFRKLIIDTGGWMQWVEWNPERHLSGGVRWDLTKDFDHQSPETKAFIGSLLGVTE